MGVMGRKKEKEGFLRCLRRDSERFMRRPRKIEGVRILVAGSKGSILLTEVMKGLSGLTNTDTFVLLFNNSCFKG